MRIVAAVFAVLVWYLAYVIASLVHYQIQCGPHVATGIGVLHGALLQAVESPVFLIVAVVTVLLILLRAMTFIKGLAALSGTVLALLIATIVFVFLKMRADYPNHPSGTQVGYDIKSLGILMLYSPIYWLVVLVVLRLSVWVFRRWVFSH